MPAAGVTSVNQPGGITRMSERIGQMQVYTSTDTRVIIYEAAHAQDYAAGINDSHFTSTSTWQQVRLGTCNAVGGALLAVACPPYFLLTAPARLWAALHTRRCPGVAMQMLPPEWHGGDRPETE